MFDAAAAVKACLPQVDMADRQPLQSGHVQDRQLVSSQAELLQDPQLLQDGRHTAEAVEGQAQVGQAFQEAQLSGQTAEKVPVQEESPQAGHRTRGLWNDFMTTSDALRNDLLLGWRPRTDCWLAPLTCAWFLHGRAGRTAGSHTG